MKYYLTSNRINIVLIGTIRSRLHRGRNLLKAQLMDYAEKRGFRPD